MTQSGKNGNGNKETDPDDIRLYEAAYSAEDEAQEEIVGWVEQNIKEEELFYLEELPPELRSDDESE
ncbi:MAG: hypothetical protein HWQ36_25890 [Nostoc sp. NMS2]|uniref:hypothetical protein n=1 Tax=Nostoc sp. NMS2 TaxID=2815389 RepID=UPI0025F85C23|nr:hypothetical protein [Nostoc sp. NMS2]MBN3993819.1 hypothetical protein [Nostoc sp. NMS2]